MSEATDYSDYSIAHVTFGRREILECDASHFLDRAFSGSLPSGPQLAEMMDMFALVIEDYDDDPRPIYIIPEIRAFYQHLYGEWPYWFFFCNLEFDFSWVEKCFPSGSCTRRQRS